MTELIIQNNTKTKNKKLAFIINQNNKKKAIQDEKFNT